MVGNFNDVQSIVKVQDKTARTVDDTYNVVDAGYPVTAPDTIFIQGILDNGAVASMALRSVRTSVDDYGFHWIISGTKGEIEFTSKPGVISFLPSGGSRIRLRKWGSEVCDVSFEVSEGDHINKVTPIGRNVARVWEAFARDDKDGFATIEEALRIHELLDVIHQSAIWAP